MVAESDVEVQLAKHAVLLHRVSYNAKAHKHTNADFLQKKNGFEIVAATKFKRLLDTSMNISVTFGTLYTFEPAEPSIYSSP